MSFDQSTSRPHREIKAADAAPATGDTGRNEITAGRAIDLKGKPAALLYVALSGTTPTATLIPYFWDELSQAWHADPSQEIELTAAGYTVHRIEGRGRYCQVRATALAGTTPVAKLSYVFPVFYGY